MAHPLFQDRTFWGVVIWEMDQEHVLNQTLVPPTFWQGRYPFFQARLPIDPSAGRLGRILLEYNERNEALHEINENPDFLEQVERA